MSHAGKKSASPLVIKDVQASRIKTYLGNVMLSWNIGWGYWSANFPKPNKGQDRAANVSQNSDSMLDRGFHMVDVLVLNRTFC